MEDLSLHILDLVQNSISAMAHLVEITIVEDSEKDWLTIIIKDDGIGMEEHVVDRVTDPFYTTRKTRKVGLGLPLFKATAEGCGGIFNIISTPGVGTCIEAGFVLSHIDRPPFGNLADTMITIILCNPEIDLVYSHSTSHGFFDWILGKYVRELQGYPLITLT